MTEHAKIAASHLARQAIVYLRQSSPSQVEHNRESTDRQYALAIKAGELGWSDDRIVIIDEDLGLSGSGTVVRSGFARLTAEVALGHVGIVVGKTETGPDQLGLVEPLRHQAADREAVAGLLQDESGEHGQNLQPNAVAIFVDRRQHFRCFEPKAFLR